MARARDTNKTYEEALKINKQYDQEAEAIKMNKQFNRTQKIKSFFSFGRKTAAKTAAVGGAVVGGVAGAGAKLAKSISPTAFGTLVFFSIAAGAYDFYTGYQGYWMVFIDLFVFLIFSANKNTLFGGHTLVILLERFAPAIFSAIAIAIPNDGIKTMAGVMIIAPYWLIYCGLLRLQGIGKESKFANITLGLAAVFLILLVIFTFKPVFQDFNYVINQKAVDQAVTFLVESTADARSTVNSLWCKYFLAPFGSSCEKDIQAAAEAATLEKSMSLKEIPNSGFSMNIVETPEENSILLDNQQRVLIEAVNNLKQPVNTVFACGIEKTGPGTPDPATFLLGTGRISAQDSTVMCKNLNLDVKRKTLTSFYFNATVTGAVSTGDKKMLVLDRAAKDAVLLKYPGISENRILLLSSEYGDYLAAAQPDLGARVSQDDLIQPLIVAGAITTSESKQTLVYGVSQNVEIPFALFIKNNGKGKITKINNITFTLNDDLYFSETNCRINKEELQKKNWGSIARGKFVMVASCKLGFSSPQYPNTLSPRSVSVKVNYDYAVSKSANVYIDAPFGSATPSSTPTSTPTPSGVTA